MSFEIVPFTLPNFSTSAASAAFFSGVSSLPETDIYIFEGGPGSRLCQISSLRLHLSLNPGLSFAPHFTVLSGSGLAPITYKQFAGFLSRVASRINLDPSRFSPRSFRRDGETFASDCDIPSELINCRETGKATLYLILQHCFSLSFWCNYYQLYEYLGLRITIFWSPLSINLLFFLLLQFGHFGVLGLFFSNRFCMIALFSKLVLPLQVSRLSNVG